MRHSSLYRRWRHCSILLLCASGWSSGSALAQDERLYTQLSPDEDGGGYYVSLVCGADKVLVGISGRSGQWVDAVKGICSRVTESGDWTGATSIAAGGTIGATSGNPYTLLCPAGFAVGGLSGRSGRWVDRLRIYCVKLGSFGWTTGSPSGGSSTGGTGGSAWGPFLCGGNKPATAIHAHDGSYVDRIGLSCFPPYMLKAITGSKSSTSGGTSFTADVVLNAFAQGRWTKVSLRSSSLVAVVPAEQTFPEERDRLTFTITTSPVRSPVQVTITATLLSSTKSFTFTVNP